MKEDDKLKTYAQGFKDGWNEAMKQSKKVDYPQIPNWGERNASQWNSGCTVCGRKGTDAMVCYNPNCPSRVTSISTGAIGAAGGSSFPLGANGGSKYV